MSNIVVCGMPQALRGSQEARASARGLQAPLAKLAADGSTKAALREAGMSAALAVAYICGALPDGTTSALSAFWALLNVPKAPLLSTTMVTRLPVEEAHIGAELAQVLLLQVSTPQSFSFLHNIPCMVLASCWLIPLRFRYLILICCLQHGHRLEDGATRDAARLLVASLLHYAPSVRHIAKKSAQECVVERSPMAGNFIAALQDYLATAPSGPVRSIS